jgi:hypothetical protein
MKKVILIALLISFSVNAKSQFSFENGSVLLPNTNEIGEHAIAVVDLNDDGKDDIVVLDYFTIYTQQEEDSVFYADELDYEDGHSAWGICAGDVDNDGFSDIMYGGYFNGLSLVKRTVDDSNYERTVFDEEDFMVFLQGINFADLNNDGNLDIYACHDVGPSRIYLGDGAGNFERDTTLINTELNGGGENDSGNYGSLFTDIDNDGDMDLYVAKCRQGVSDPEDPRRINLLFINQGDTLYTEQADDYGIASGQQSWSADFGDVDNDGDMDLLLGQHSGQYVQLFLNNGAGSFADATSASGLYNSFEYHVIQSKFTDFDNNGYLDIIIAGSSQFMFASNNGDGTFDIVSDPNIHNSMNSFALGDLNYDGYIDVYSTPGGYGGGWGTDSYDSLYLNSGGLNNFLHFELEGVVSNRDGIGARVVLYGDFGMQIREIRSGESYGIQNSLNAHFGLGQASAIDSAFVYWPSGIIDQFVGTAANQFLYVVEGAHPVGIKEAIVSAFSFSLYPNPSVDYFRIRFDESKIGGKQVTIQIIDLLGKEISRYSTIRSDQQINVSDLKHGFYIVNLQVDGITVASQKLKVE